MVGLGVMEILLLLACVGVFFLAPAAFAIVFSLTQQRSAAAPHPAVPPPRAYPPVAQTPVAAAEDAESRQAIVARLTQRFCPGCRAPLAADAPEGHIAGPCGRRTRRCWNGG